MRIALCFFGQPRFIKECFTNIEKFVLETNKMHDIDVFVHTWFSQEMCDAPLYSNEYSSFSGGSTIQRDSIESIRSLYKPKQMVVDPPKRFKPTEKIYKDYIKFHITENSYCGLSQKEFLSTKTETIYSQTYSLMRVMTLKKTYELQEGFEYDWVIKMRFDNIFTQPLELNNLNSDYFYYQQMSKPYYEIPDWINFSNSLNMDLISMIYMDFERISNHSVKNYGGWSIESLLKSTCELNKIELKALNIGTKLPVWGKI